MSSSYAFGLYLNFGNSIFSVFTVRSVNIATNVSGLCEVADKLDEKFNLAVT
ncbi:hypothetical protein [Weeksella virosa]|uniref:hypothetical protein n=1 Tax=Weeksella virosa TaxID=1014 RepID=UPI0025521DA9|nr:hypothetical protein [Weeksella virosa]MDK7674976.1 hypothetical protein [Weeksella virosa]